MLLVGCTTPDTRTHSTIPLIKGPYEISNPDIQVKRIAPIPRYPAKALKDRISGDVTLIVTINEQGIPTKAKAVSGPVALMQSAEEILMKTEFKPAQGKALAGETTFNFVMPFRLK